MHVADLHASSDLSKTTRFRWMAGLATCSALLFTGCNPPGMKLDVRPQENPTPTNMGGIDVTVRPLSAQVLEEQAVRGSDFSAIQELLGSKPAPYRIGPSDVLLVTVWDHPEITLPLGQYRTDEASGSVVDSDGAIFFPYVGKIRVSGMTVPEARDLVTASLAKVLQKPQVDVKVLAYRSQKVYVGGEVKNPANYSVTDVPFTLAEAVNRAGGFLPTSDDSRLILSRGGRSWRLNFQSLMTNGNRIGEVVLRDGDSLQVPNAKEEPVYMMGEVVRPGTMPLIHGSISLAQAISEAGGIQVATADARSIYVIRPTGVAKAVDVFHLDGSNPTSMILADKFMLSPHDIVFVDAGSLVRFSRVMNLLLPTINAVTSTALTNAEIRNLNRN